MLLYVDKASKLNYSPEYPYKCLTIWWLCKNNFSRFGCHDFSFRVTAEINSHDLLHERNVFYVTKYIEQFIY